EQWGAGPIAEATFFEFGVGWDMTNPIALSILGVGRQIVVDLQALARPELIDDVLLRMAEVDGFDEPRLRWFRDVSAVALREQDPAGKLRHLGIDYRAPADARATGLPEGSI